MIVLDTNVVSEALRREPDPRVVAWLRGHPDEFAITSITVAEVLAGLQRLPEGRRRQQLCSAFEAALRPYRESRVLPFDASAATEYAVVVGERSSRGRPISTADAQIAAICRSREAACATRNIKDFVHTGVSLIDPWV